MPNEYRAGKDGSVKLDTTGLENLLAGIDEKYFVKVGILGNKAAAKHQRKQTGEVKKTGGHKKGNDNSDMTNADIGLVHEKGVKSLNIPRRSFLATPLEDNLPSYFAALGAETIKNMVLNQDITAYQELGVVSEQIIIKAFETGGNGKWPELKPATVQAKNSSKILIDTAQLKNSITFEVVKR